MICLPRRRWSVAALVAGVMAVILLVSLPINGPGRVNFVSTARIEVAIPGVPRGESRRGASEDVGDVALEVESELLEPSPFGPLPRIGPRGQRPFFAYGSPFDLEDSRPKVAILVQGLGLQRDVTDAALDLPAHVGLQFSPYAPDLDEDVANARARGHEVMLALPMEPREYPLNDPGPNTLLVDAGPEENLDRLHWILGRTIGYVGLAGPGGRFASSAAVAPVIAEIAGRGLAVIEVGTNGLTDVARSAGLPYARAAAPIDADPSPLSIDYALAGLEAEALENGSALGVLSAYPVSMARLAEWARSLESKGLVLAPVSALLIEGAGLAAQLRGDGGRGRGPDHG